MSDKTIIAVEGIDGAGKTTLIENIRDYYGDEFYYTYEPTGYWTGQAVERCKGFDSNSTFFAFLMDRAFNVAEMPDDKPIITDRYIYSTLAYQQELIDYDGWMGKEEYIKQVLSIFPEPDLTFYVRLRPENSVDRTGEGDKYEDLSFLRGVHENYDRLMFSLHENKVQVLTGTDKPDFNANVAIKRLQEYVD